jgi:DNA-binding NtrC family response regulator
MQQGRIPMILLVDDGPEHNVAMMKVLERAGYNVASAADGHEALSKLMNQPFDLVITDLLMPRMSGLDLLRSIKATQPGVGVIVLTAFGEWTSYVEAMNIGAEEYLNKPVRRTDLLLAVQNALGRGKAWRSKGLDVEPEQPGDPTL